MRSGFLRGREAIVDLHRKHVFLHVASRLARLNFVEVLLRDDDVVLSRWRSLAKGVVVPRRVSVHNVLQQTMVLGSLEDGPAGHGGDRHLLLRLGHDEGDVQPAQRGSGRAMGSSSLAW